MEDFTRFTPEELFTRTLQLFKIPGEDFKYRHIVSTDETTNFKWYMYKMFNNLERPNDIITVEKDPKNRERLMRFVTLRDHNGLSILGYLLLLGKTGGVSNLYSNVVHDKDIQDIISSRLNADLTSVLDYYSLNSSILVDNIKKIKTYVPSFRLSEENARLIGYRMAKDAFPEFDLPDNRLFPRFTNAIPDRYVPYVTQPPPGPPPSHSSTPPSYPPPHSYPPPPPSHPPSHTQQYTGPPPPQYQYPPPPGSPPYRNGGTRNNHKRHKKQMRKHASKKSKHV